MENFCVSNLERVPLESVKKHQRFGGVYKIFADLYFYSVYFVHDV